MLKISSDSIDLQKMDNKQFINRVYKAAQQNTDKGGEKNTNIISIR